MKYHLNDVIAHCQTRPELWTKITQNHKISADFQHIETDMELPLTPVIDVPHGPRPNWPIWARLLRQFRRRGEIGLGDTVVHLIGDSRSARFREWFLDKFGRSCGCADRQAWLNRRYPYLSST